MKRSTEGLQDAVARVFADFSSMLEPSIRGQIAGNKTGPAGTDSVDFYGYINYLKDCDASVQWALFMHHYGLGVDIGPWHGVWGRFMIADTPVPEGFKYFDFVPQNNGKAGPPYLSQFAYATFSGDMDAMHKVEGFDGDAMYDVTRNTMLGEGVNIPYPDKYWTAEVFLDGWDKYSTAYMFSAEL